jgi:hypothetical protein
MPSIDQLPAVLRSLPTESCNRVLQSISRALFQEMEMYVATYGIRPYRLEEAYLEAGLDFEADFQRALNHVSAKPQENFDEGAA